eukprot:CAMPEP_0203963668 /NCGR_PEP_ID=MMETSP0359-20131031/93575_1 /ASSEMBLY_ACC=CAM_ASM_000338 /TAXON_ID=268821 /ORGANISM="Scrippsiella Hangoei, Strain SHTV-5" /LENGTH=37 /DNA_ID= /DNA_START= /DNA_END= /DNA_ORIENTATION=
MEYVRSVSQLGFNSEHGYTDVIHRGGLVCGLAGKRAP